MKRYRAIGLMSGTSLDGVDVAACEFISYGKTWSYSIHAARTYPYPDEWSEKLATLQNASALDYCMTHVAYGHFLGSLVQRFIGETGFEAMLIASHGHTVFHQPQHKLTVQVGSGSAISVETGLPVVCDFRTADVALGGQGAPLVPIGDRLLFHEFDACLNLGGFANISLERSGERIAFDICPVNFVLNLLAARAGLKYDENGRLAATGQTDPGLLRRLNELEYYSRPHPKSLGREWVEQEIIPLLDQSGLSTASLLQTFCAHIAEQVAGSVGTGERLKVLVTGGGACNTFLMDQIRKTAHHDFMIPAPEVVDYKEALIFAFLGILRWTGQINVLRSVTGGSMDHSGGTVWAPIPPPLPPDESTSG